MACGLHFTDDSNATLRRGPPDCPATSASTPASWSPWQGRRLLRSCTGIASRSRRADCASRSRGRRAGTGDRSTIERGRGGGSARCRACTGCGRPALRTPPPDEHPQQIRAGAHGSHTVARLHSLLAHCAVLRQTVRPAAAASLVRAGLLDLAELVRALDQREAAAIRIYAHQRDPEREPGRLRRPASAPRGTPAACRS